MIDVQHWFFLALSYPIEAGLQLNASLIFWGVVVAAFFLSRTAALFVLVGALAAFLACCNRTPDPYPKFKGKLDLLFGRWFCVSSAVKSNNANNNVSLIAFDQKIVVAYRTAETHFASPLARIVVVTADDQDLEDWKEIWSYQTGANDLRETLFFELNGRLFLYFVCLVPNKREGFLPQRTNWTSTGDLKVWLPPAEVGRVTEIVWDVKVVDTEGHQVAYKTSYTGNHYAAYAVVSVLFEQSTNGSQWKSVGKDSTVYVGGVSEVSFAFTAKGDLVAIGRNEDGDASGFGSQLFFARKGDLGSWVPLKMSIPYRFDSPRMVCLDGHVLLFARYARESYAAIPGWLPLGLQQIGNLFAYSALPKGGAAYYIKEPGDDGCWCEQPVHLIQSLEGTFGDTGFFSITKNNSAGDLILANYASSSLHSHAPWVVGQFNYATEVHVCRLRILSND